LGGGLIITIIPDQVVFNITFSQLEPAFAAVEVSVSLFVGANEISAVG
jgi:hypothetical protein